MLTNISNALTLPAMLIVRQNFEVPPRLDIEAAMETVFLDTSEEGIPLFLDRLAHEADGIVLINRVKPHTNFIGATESGIMKMLAIGLGNQKGAEHYHRLSLLRSQYEIILASYNERRFCLEERIAPAPASARTSGVREQHMGRLWKEQPLP
jgi:hypothetical protein